MNLRYQRLTDPSLNFAKFKVGDLVRYIPHPILYDYFGRLIKIDEGVGLITAVFYYETSEVFNPENIKVKCEYDVFWLTKNQTLLIDENSLCAIDDPI